MRKTAKKIIREEYKRLKHLLDKIMYPGKQKTMPQWVLEPVKKKLYHTPVYSK